MKLYNNLIICLLFALSPFLNGCNYARNCVNASGHEVTQTRSIDEFSGIDIGGSAKVFLKQGDQQSVRITASDNLQEFITTRVSGGRLKIRFDRNICHEGNVVVYITMKDLDAIDVSGSVTVITENKFNVQDLDINISGSANLKLAMNAKEIKTSCSGGSEIEMKGSASANYVDVSGSVRLNAREMIVGKYDVRASGSSNMDLYVTDELNVDASGSSDITYKGNPRTVTNQSSGSSSLKKRE